MMKNLCLFIAFFSIHFTISAQKNYSTTTAVVRFIAEDDQDIDAINTKVVSRLQSNGELSFIMLMKDFSFQMDKMQAHFNEEYVESEKFPRALFNGKILSFQTIQFTKDGNYPITVIGNMQVHGVNKPITTTGMIEIKNGKPIATSKFIVSLKDFEIGGLLIAMVADKINVEVKAIYQ